MSSLPPSFLLRVLHLYCQFLMAVFQVGYVKLPKSATQDKSKEESQFGLFAYACMKKVTAPKFHTLERQTFSGMSARAPSVQQRKPLASSAAGWSPSQRHLRQRCARQSDTKYSSSPVLFQRLTPVPISIPRNFSF